MPRLDSWRLSNTPDASFCIEALQEALMKYGTPEIFNTDRGSQFTVSDFIELLSSRDIRISMDGKGRWLDNVIIERLWKSVKYEDVYLTAYSSIAAARHGLREYFEFYNRRRRHQSLDRKMPDKIFLSKLPQKQVAA